MGIIIQGGENLAQTFIDERIITFGRDMQPAGNNPGPDPGEKALVGFAIVGVSKVSEE